MSFGHIRDTLSQNNLKLPDLTRLRELVTGDLLLRIDSRLARELDGVYHHGPVYLRASHRLSALAFGTPFGRFLTRYVALPFGGAFLTVEGLSHIVHLFDTEPEAAASLEPSLEVLETTILTTDAHTIRPDVLGVAQVLLLGVFLLMLLENATFRHGCLAGLRWLGRVGRKLVYDLPVVTLRLPWVRWLLDSPLYTAVVSYLLKPLLITGCLLFPFQLSLGGIGWPTAAITFLVLNLTVNSPIGRYADEWLADQLLRGLRGLHIHVFVAGFRLIMDSFNWLLQAIEQVLYTVDEWLLFRTGESRWVLAAKAVVGAIWAVINYVVRIYVTLLIEPQINPIKHFPVVTVSHKIMLPFSIHLTRTAGGAADAVGGCVGQHDCREHRVSAAGRVWLSGLGAEGELAALCGESSPRISSRFRSASMVRRCSGCCGWGSIPARCRDSSDGCGAALAGDRPAAGKRRTNSRTSCSTSNWRCGISSSGSWWPCWRHPAAGRPGGWKSGASAWHRTRSVSSYAGRTWCMSRSG